MKRAGIIGFILSLALVSTLLVGKAHASEGVFELGSVGNSGSSCYVLSVYANRQYVMLGTCRGLITPYSAEQNRYVLWRLAANGSSVKVGEIKNGKIEGSASEKFVGLFVSAEVSASPRKPSESVVARGELKAIPLVGEAKVAPTPTPTKSVAKSEAVESTKEKSGLTKVLATIGRIVGIGFLILLVAVVVMTIVTRRKEQV